MAGGRAKLYRHLGGLGIPVELYAPPATPAGQLQEAFLAGGGNGDMRGATSASAVGLPAAWVALVETLARIDREPYHWPVGRTGFQKLAYFATEVGLPTGLRFSRGSYGPFAADLKQVTSRLINNGLVEEQRLGRMFALKPGPTYPDAARTFSSELAGWDSVINRITDLFLRMNTDQAEVAASVHFSARQLERQKGERPSEFDVLKAVGQWKQNRRPPLKEQDLVQAIRNLNMLHWVDLQPSDQLPFEEEELLSNV
jgi:uncharacterized protein YwgA